MEWRERKLVQILTTILFAVFLLEYRPDEAAFVKLDSSLKKNTALVRKLVSMYGPASIASVLTRSQCNIRELSSHFKLE